MWDAAGNWIGLSVWIDTAPWWVQPALDLIVVGGIYAMMLGFILALIERGRRF